MFCPQCGKEYTAKVNFCCQCGTAMSTPHRACAKLRRSRQDSKIAGVCGGVAEYLEVDSTLIRLIWLMLAFFGGWGILGYIIAWIIMPQAPEPATAPVAASSGVPQPAGQ